MCLLPTQRRARDGHQFPIARRGRPQSRAVPALGTLAPALCTSLLLLRWACVRRWRLMPCRWTWTLATVPLSSATLCCFQSARRSGIPTDHATRAADAHVHAISPMPSEVSPTLPVSPNYRLRESRRALAGMPCMLFRALFQACSAGEQHAAHNPPPPVFLCWRQSPQRPACLMGSARMSRRVAKPVRQRVAATQAVLPSYHPPASLATYGIDSAHPRSLRRCNRCRRHCTSCGSE